MKCKNGCDKDATKYSKYSSGEFCSKKCANPGIDSFAEPILTFKHAPHNVSL